MSSESPITDLFVIGGGINGCGIARDAVGRGYSVVLAEMDDLASGTSSAATKLVHGGLRYLEHFEFRLVHEALAEREVLWAMAPHVIWPLRFVLPHQRGMRPAFVLRTGLLMYDNLGGRKLLPPTSTLDLSRDEVGRPLKPGFRTAFEYSDCWVDDARLVALVARDAADRGAIIRTRTKVVSAERHDGGWTIGVENVRSGERETIGARMLVNAAGPWVDRVITGAMRVNGARNVRLVKGSHIVVPKLYEHERCYFLQNRDGRIFFAIPYERDFTLIGTTDEDYNGDPADAAISQGEIDYLCGSVSSYFRSPVTPAQIVWTYSGVRPLYDDGASAAQEATRDYVLRVDGEDGQSAVLNVFGGKLTTFRRLAEEALVRIGQVLGERGEPWTRSSRLPGGDFPATGFPRLLLDLGQEFPGIPRPLLLRLARQYGTLARAVLGTARTPADLGEEFGAGLHAAEVDHLMGSEWALTANDVLWRRTKLGLRLDAGEAARLAAYMTSKGGMA